ncbi:MAG TPA: YhdP family protein, partial [Methylophilaceae bacterium]|nr:YhdP family protein [Methylophilaceae bacterium]
MVKKSLFWFYRITLIAIWTGIFIFAASVLSLRYLVLPHIQDYKPTIEQRLSKAVGQKVVIGSIEASWHGLDPHLSLKQVVLHDLQQRPALTLDLVEASLSWLSIPLLEPRLSTLTIHRPELTIRREPDGILYIAGMAMGGPSRPTFGNWLLRQAQIDVVDATVLWQDDLRGAPPLTLNNLQFRLVSPAWESLVGRHRFGLKAVPSAGSSQPIDIRGNLYGKDVSRLDQWRGTLYGRAEGTDIAAWRNWITYPFDLREGFGAAQFWADFSKGEIRRVTSDVVFRNVHTKLSENSQDIRLSQLSGRLRWIRHENGDEFRAQRVKLAMADGLNMQDGNLGWREQVTTNGKSIEGDIQLDEIRLETLRSFAAYLPLPAATMQKIADIAPVGELRKLNLHWKGVTTDAEGKYQLPDTYSIRTQFAGLGMQADDKIPGFANLSGRLDANEAKGLLVLNSRQATLDFNKVFRNPIPADALTGQIEWNRNRDRTEFRLTRLALSNAHLAAIANGRYLDNSKTSDSIDLQATASRADARFASNYYPLILSKGLMDWLDKAIIAGQGEDIRVELKGNLHDFPFPDDRKGLFKVTAKVNNGVLEFAEGWPRIDGITLDMLFHGTRMELNATEGNLLGNRITQAQVVIPVLNATQPVLTVNGQAQGPVNEGIRYVNSSPIRETMGGFTDALQASGNGKLNLQLTVPLHNVAATRFKGAYTVSNGSLASPDLPTLTRVNGKVDFTESTLRAQNVNAWIYGGPAQFTLSTGKDKVHHINARGSITDAGLREAFGSGFADRLSGTTDWVGDIHVRPQQVDLSIRSSMVGMASGLPSPLAKAAEERMPVRIEKKQQSAQQDTISLNLGNIVGARLLRTARNGGELAIDRGEIGLNVLPEIPTQPGLSIRGTLDTLDLDEWRNLLDKTTATTGGSGKGGATVNLSRINLAVGTLDVFGRRINDLSLSGKATGNNWNVTLQSREITGDAQWLGQGEGKVIARLKNLTMPASTPSISQLRTQGAFKEQAEDYPALDIVAD